ncbi:uncharacterized protein KY384_002806 [Bacidia gigantensis]|uniref:uncharacterized protein n=1 Tax=Bacidia gigantensis TaxID=2732470 RepID=UPI001D040879|nr:uncharacterized protein KY384_002806 [Bacidia gigantensis]KAG8532928.1 hypothetical protein KY384_002806 [Bacidia gigantensis]
MASPASTPRPPTDSPPYTPKIAVLGGYPTVEEDVPISAVFMLLFLLAAVGHMTIFIRNKKRGHKFLISGAMFGFCMARNLACILRIVWAAEPSNVSVVIAAQLFASLGDIFGYVINLIFTQRILRAAIPYFGWRRVPSFAFIFVYGLLFLSASLLVGFTVGAYYTLDKEFLKASRDISIYGSTVFATTSVLPLFILPAILAVRTRAHEENFGHGSLLSKVVIVLFGTMTMACGQWYRTGTTYANPHPRAHPALYQAKGAFYVFYFTMDVVVIWSYLLLRMDRRFWVPNGSSGPGDYSKGWEDDRVRLSLVGRDGEDAIYKIRPMESHTSLTLTAAADAASENLVRVFAYRLCDVEHGGETPLEEMGSAREAPV